jgi:hypothetical protein
MTRDGRTTFAIPDAAVWTMQGRDPLREGYAPTAAPERAEVFLVPEHLPADLGPAVSDAWARMAPPRAYLVFGDPVEGEPVGPVLSGAPPAHSHAGDEHDDAHHAEAAHGHAGHDAHGDHDHEGHAHGDHHHEHGHGGHDHHDMMAIVGDPSADGLIMEPLDFAIGPFAPSLPGGLVIDVSLDGDVVARARARASVTLGGADDPLAPLTWRIARERAASAPAEAAARRQVVALEIERALSHALSFKSVASAMGWRELSDASHDLARALLPLRETASKALDASGAAPSTDTHLRAADKALAKVGRLATRRRARRRLARRGVLDRRVVEETKVGGPLARAAGVVSDARSTDPIYTALDFTPEAADDGDAAARVAVRVAEGASSLRLARAAAAEVGAEETIEVSDGPGLPVTVEGPRGPVVAIAGPDDRVAVATPGAEAALELAGHAVIGLELGPAIVTLASFDLSPWRVDG